MARSRGQPRKIKMRHEIHSRRSQEFTSSSTSLDPAASCTSSSSVSSASLPDLTLADENTPSTNVRRVRHKNKNKESLSSDAIAPDSAPTTCVPLLHHDKASVRKLKKGRAKSRSDMSSNMDDDTRTSSVSRSLADLMGTPDSSADSSGTVRPNSGKGRGVNAMSFRLQDGPEGDDLDVIGSAHSLISDTSSKKAWVGAANDSNSNKRHENMFPSRNKPKIPTPKHLKSSPPAPPSPPAVPSLSEQSTGDTVFVTPRRSPSESVAVTPAVSLSERGSDDVSLVSREHFTEHSRAVDELVSKTKTVIPSPLGIDSLVPTYAPTSKDPPITAFPPSDTQNDSTPADSFGLELTDDHFLHDDQSPILVASFSHDTSTTTANVSPFTDTRSRQEPVVDVVDAGDNFASRRYSATIENSPSLESLASSGSTTLGDPDQPCDTKQWAIVPSRPTSLIEYSFYSKAFRTTPATIGLSGFMLRHTFLIPETRVYNPFVSFYKK